LSATKTIASVPERVDLRDQHTAIPRVRGGSLPNPDAVAAAFDREDVMGWIKTTRDVRRSLASIDDLFDVAVEESGLFAERHRIL
jgi:hypothetical protein